jgi:hypothetical protein
MLLGIKDGSGLGNNAEEIKTASLLMDNTVIRPFQELLIDCFDNILAYNEISLNLYFTTLQPLEFTEVDQTLQDRETIEEETGVEMSKVHLKTIDGKQAYDTKEEAEKVAEDMGCTGHHEHEVEGVVYYMPCVSHEELKAPCWDGYEQIGTKTKDGKEVPNCVPLEKKELTKEMAQSILENIVSEKMTEDFELVEAREYSNKNSNTEDWANSLIKKKKSSLRKFADFITSKPNAESRLDKSYYKIRYTYQERVSSANSRDFCKTMMNRTSRGVVYRKEDIDNATAKGVNNEFGHKGRDYSLFEFKGGIYCGHYWQEELYRMKDKTEKYISKGTEVNSIPKSYQPKGKEYTDAGIAPTDMKNRGAYPK